MSDSEMVERVARALALVAGSQITGPGQHVASREIGWEPGNTHMDKYVERHWKEHVTAAKFAIEAMREPTNAMVTAALIQPYPTVHEAGGLMPQAHTAAKLEWQAMIDEALK